MKVSKRDGSPERRILIGQITNNIVAGQIAAKWEEGLYRTKWANLVGGWAVKFFNKYERAPGRDIEAWFDRWAAKHADKETIELVEDFLRVLSHEYERNGDAPNPQVILDLAGEHFNKVKMQRLQQQLEEDLENDKVTEAQDRIVKFAKVELGVGAGIDVLEDENAVKQTFEEKRELLIKFPGALGAFFHDALERDAFVAVQAPEKRGKSMVLQKMAYLAIKQGRKVAYFEAGDMSQNQVMRRFLTLACRRPLRRTKRSRPVRYPTGIVPKSKSIFYEIESEERTYEEPVTWEQAHNKLRKISEKYGGKLKLSCHQNSTLNVNGIVSILQSWERNQNFEPEIIIIDYADILAPLVGNEESRDQINRTWKALRALSQSRHCLVLTATQAKATSYSNTTMSMEDFSEDKRKYGHVTGMFGINQTQQEKKDCVARWNWLVLRESDFDITKVVNVAECRALADIAVLSSY